MTEKDRLIQEKDAINQKLQQENAGLREELREIAAARSGNRIGYEVRREVYRRAIATWGDQAQLMMVIEEMSELTNSLCKLFRVTSDRISISAVADECADVTIMLEQLRLILEINDAVCERMDYKIERLASRLGMEIPGGETA